jgi:hypothetical protein
MGQLFDPKYGPVVAIGPYTVANLDTALTNTDLIVGQAGNTLALMPAAGTVVGLSVVANAAPSAGTAVFSVHAASTELVNGPTATVNSASNSNGTQGLANSAREHTFAQGARLGISATTSTNLAATTVDYTAFLFVRFDPDGAALG